MNESRRHSLSEIQRGTERQILNNLTYTRTLKMSNPESAQCSYQGLGEEKRGQCGEGDMQIKGYKVSGRKTKPGDHGTA
jgi:hypothetical protein